MRIRFTGYVTTFFWALWFTFPYLLVAAAVSAVFGLVNQTQELYRAFAQDLSAHLQFVILAVLGLFLLTYVTWLVVRDTMRSNPDLSAFERPGFALIFRFFPAFIASLIPAGAALGMAQAARADPKAWFARHKITELFEGLSPGGEDLKIIAALLALCTVAFFFATFCWGDRLESAFLRRLTRYKRFPTGFILFTLLSILIYIWPLSVTRFFGAPALVMLFALCITVLIRFFYNYSPFLNAAGLLVLFGYVFILITLGVNGYHVEPVKLERLVNYKETAAAFDDWLRRRADKPRFADAHAPYPVFLVAASGGGLYAARHTAVALARIQDSCPSFAQHVFAISGISGGSWGSAIFHTLARAKAQNSDTVTCNIEPGNSRPAKGNEFESMTAAILKGDFLSPLIGVGLFPNMFQFILPRSVTRLNRSAVFAKTIEESLDNKDLGENPLGRPVSSAWDPNSPGGALLLNMTDADRGYQVVAAPFTVQSKRRQDENAFMLAQRMLNRPDTDDASPLRVQKDLKISSAVAMSAGFPVVIGAGDLVEKLPDGKTERRRLVDGGYYENSGVETLLQIIDQLRDREKNLDVSFHVIILDSHYPVGQEDAIL
jgi:hypothetical protein